MLVIRNPRTTKCTHLPCSVVAFSSRDCNWSEAQFYVALRCSQAPGHLLHNMDSYGLLSRARAVQAEIFQMGHDDMRFGKGFDSGSDFKGISKRAVGNDVTNRPTFMSPGRHVRFKETRKSPPVCENKDSHQSDRAILMAARARLLERLSRYARNAMLPHLASQPASCRVHEENASQDVLKTSKGLLEDITKYVVICTHSSLKTHS